MVRDSSDSQNTQDITVPVNTVSKDNSIDSPKVGRLPKWDDDETFRFVELYKEAECLWNSEIPQYRHKPSRIKAILSIIAKMNMELTIQEVKSKIKNLRSTYSQELYKIEKSRKSEDLEQYVPMIRWFYVMDSFVHVRRVIEHVRRGESTLVSDPYNIFLWIVRQLMVAIWLYRIVEIHQSLESGVASCSIDVSPGN